MLYTLATAQRNHGFRTNSRDLALVEKPSVFKGIWSTVFYIQHSYNRAAVYITYKAVAQVY